VVIVIIVLVLVRVFSGGSTSTSTPTSTSTSTSGPRAGAQAPHPRTGPDPDAKLVDFVKFVMKDIQQTYEGMFQAQGKAYRHAKLVLFTSEINTGCGLSSSEIGPFYCPPDEKAYIDLSFYRELRDRFGAPGEFAEAYVLAHELGHHLQHLMGIEERARQLGGKSKKARNEVSVKQELQADCFAGVWGHAAKARNLLETGDIESALGAATAIGDDRLQKQAGMKVNAETWTHGSSEQRVRWFKKGFDAGTFEVCDTFAAASL
jgi:predicted metalloprotease